MLRRNLALFERDRRGAAALEFAIILPLIALIYLGGYDAMRLLRVYDKTQTAAKTVADLVGQEPTNQAIPTSEVALLLSSAPVAATPYNDTTNFSVTASAIDLKLNGQGACCDATVRWSATQNGTLRPCGVTLTQIGSTGAWSTSTIPSKIATQQVIPINGLQTWAPSVVVVDISYNNVSLTPGISTFATRMIWQHAYAIPRLYGQVTVASSGNKPAAMTGLSSGQTGKVCS